MRSDSEPDYPQYLISNLLCNTCNYFNQQTRRLSFCTQNYIVQKKVLMSLKGKLEDKKKDNSVRKPNRPYIV